MSIGRFRVSHVYEVIGIDLLMHQSIDELKHHPIVQQANRKKQQGASLGGNYVNVGDMLNLKKNTNLKRLESEQKLNIIKRLATNYKRNDIHAYKQLDQEVYM